MASEIRNNKHCQCPVEATLEVIGGKWKPIILWQLRTKKLRFSGLQQSMQGISPKMLTKQLRELEEDGLILREVYPEIPPKVEYSLTEFGMTVLPVLEALCKWGVEYLGRECVLNKQQSSGIK
ncbi:helix-turn-helix domain-containing protein [Methanosarcina sp.]|uniref:winged helix-turn-helix transcriptional regulator n=1 Tax=Methanosarcina sp. TaxID=2213 RepID=UPI00298877A9|nr:helix-turn-helix domain-containing protein [Methanosarcina sp.]MDW5549993.1 helix-turn-helix domain-containing protein [Methanosarcina sp.]MDW5553947.1 helix-turn-helix domain-containing protein [Methanosarcina sp.]MDW5558548.1 helix-turn-helix domain-containing protein [Methanosarcina sp.]